MKITAIVTRYQEDSLYCEKGSLKEVTAQDALFCCDDMHLAWDQGFVGFGEADSILNKNSDANVYRCSAYPEGAVFEEMPIRFCPFCAAKIEIKIEDLHHPKELALAGS